MGAGLKQVWMSPLTEVNSVAKEVLGAHRYENGKWYKYVNLKNTTATVAAAAGSLVAYFAATGYGNNRVVVDLTDADSAVFVAGAMVAAVAGVLTVDYYAWMQIKGLCTLDTAIGSGAAGSPWYLTSTDKTGAIASAATQAVGGISMNTTTGVILDCVF